MRINHIFLKTLFMAIFSLNNVWAEPRTLEDIQKVRNFLSDNGVNQILVAKGIDSETLLQLFKGNETSPNIDKLWSEFIHAARQYNNGEIGTQHDLYQSVQKMASQAQEVLNTQTANSRNHSSSASTAAAPAAAQGAANSNRSTASASAASDQRRESSTASSSDASSATTVKNRTAQIEAKGPAPVAPITHVKQVSGYCKVTTKTKQTFYAECSESQSKILNSSGNYKSVTFQQDTPEGLTSPSDRDAQKRPGSSASNIRAYVSASAFPASWAENQVAMITAAAAETAETKTSGKKEKPQPAPIAQQPKGRIPVTQVPQVEPLVETQKPEESVPHQPTASSGAKKDTMRDLIPPITSQIDVKKEVQSPPSSSHILIGAVKVPEPDETKKPAKPVQLVAVKHEAPPTQPQSETRGGIVARMKEQFKGSGGDTPDTYESYINEYELNRGTMTKGGPNHLEGLHFVNDRLPKFLPKSDDESKDTIGRGSPESTIVQSIEEKQRGALAGPGGGSPSADRAYRAAAQGGQNKSETTEIDKNNHDAQVGSAYAGITLDNRDKVNRPGVAVPFDEAANQSGKAAPSVAADKEINTQEKRTETAAAASAQEKPQSAQNTVAPPAVAAQAASPTANKTATHEASAPVAGNTGNQNHGGLTAAETSKHPGLSDQQISLLRDIFRVNKKGDIADGYISALGTALQSRAIPKDDVDAIIRMHLIAGAPNSNLTIKPSFESVINLFKDFNAKSTYKTFQALLNDSNESREDLRIAARRKLDNYTLKNMMESIAPATTHRESITPPAQAPSAIEKAQQGPQITNEPSASLPGQGPQIALPADETNGLTEDQASRLRRKLKQAGIKPNQIEIYIGFLNGSIHPRQTNSNIHETKINLSPHEIDHLIEMHLVVDNSEIKKLMEGMGQILRSSTANNRDRILKGINAIAIDVINKHSGDSLIPVDHRSENLESLHSRLHSKLLIRDPIYKNLNVQAEFYKKPEAMKLKNEIIEAYFSRNSSDMGLSELKWTEPYVKARGFLEGNADKFQKDLVLYNRSSDMDKMYIRTGGENAIEAVRSFHDGNMTKAQEYAKRELALHDETSNSIAQNMADKFQKFLTLSKDPSFGIAKIKKLYELQKSYDSYDQAITESERRNIGAMSSRNELHSVRQAYLPLLHEADTILNRQGQSSITPPGYFNVNLVKHREDFVKLKEAKKKLDLILKKDSPLYRQQEDKYSQLLHKFLESQAKLKTITPSDYTESDYKAYDDLLNHHGLAPNEIKETSIVTHNLGKSQDGATDHNASEVEAKSLAPASPSGTISSVSASTNIKDPNSAAEVSRGASTTATAQVGQYEQVRAAQHSDSATADQTSTAAVHNSNAQTNAASISSTKSNFDLAMAKFKQLKQKQNEIESKINESKAQNKEVPLELWNQRSQNHKDLLQSVVHARTLSQDSQSNEMKDELEKSYGGLKSMEPEVVESHLTNMKKTRDQLDALRFKTTEWIKATNSFNESHSILENNIHSLKQERNTSAANLLEEQLNQAKFYKIIPNTTTYVQVEHLQPPETCSQPRRLEHMLTAVTAFMGNSKNRHSIDSCEQTTGQARTSSGLFSKTANRLIKPFGGVLTGKSKTDQRSGSSSARTAGN